MKILLTLFEHSQGISSKTGKAFDMASVQAHLPASDFSKEGYSRTVRGFEPCPIEINASVIPKLRDMTFPCLADVETETRVMRSNGRSVPVMVISAVTNWVQLVPAQGKAA
ncbi:hypothetical protein [Chromobacterium haemolyticum]|uniref:hypothetical protein n=1 Tax=Chromobacterium haemolyticum TaxID=394935 RepID=UPI0024480C76|nr:hypothetical protein [Chromobacterium haemolyticum]MDH0340242.1 hypothetical protein [Chromobacterium haemolyticum]